jgi:hypothetical protein
MRGALVPGLILVAAASCVGDGLETESWRARIGDAASCDPADAGCWPERDRAALARVLRLVDTGGGSSSTRRTEALCDAARRLDADLGHKLEAAERAVLAEAQVDLCGPAPDEPTLLPTAARLSAGGLRRLEGEMVRAYMAPVAEAIDALADAPSCLQCAAVVPGAAVAAVAIPERWPAGVRSAIAEIAGAGVFGQALATMLVTGGALDLDYGRENAILFGELDAETGAIVGSGLSIEARVERIVDDAEAAATWAGAVTGAETLVPIAGIAVSIAHEEWWMLAIHVEMMLRIATVYGWDLTDGPTLLAALSIVMQDGLLPEGTDVVVPSVTVPIVMRQAGTRFGVWTAGRVGSFLTLKAGAWIVTMLRRRAATALTSQVVRQGGKAIAQQVLGWLTAGAGIVIGAVGDRILTTVLGRRAAHTGKRWLGDLHRESSPFVGDATARGCAFRTFAAMVVADGALSALEERLYGALVARPIWTGDTHSFVAGPAEQAERAQALRAAVQADGAEPCRVRATFGDAPGAERRTLLATTFALAAIDGVVQREERALQDELGAALEGGIFAPLDVSLVEQIERTIGAEVALPQSDVGREAGLTLEDVVPALRATR